MLAFENISARDAKPIFLVSSYPVIVERQEFLFHANFVTGTNIKLSTITIITLCVGYYRTEFVFVTKIKAVHCKDVLQC